MTGKKIRLDTLLLERGYFDSLKSAQGWVMAHKVVVNEQVVDKPGMMVQRDVVVQLRGLRLKYASRGGIKLEHALQRFGLDVTGLRCLDVGASTGGFTDCLLQAGAAQVLAVDVGYGQLRGSLACDPRVIHWERTNLSELSAEILPFALDLAVLDLSYLSMGIALPATMALFANPARIVFLIKPLYEGLNPSAPDDHCGLTGVLHTLFTDLAAKAVHPLGACVSPILGGRGAIEFLSWFDARHKGLSTEELVHMAMEDLRRAPPSPVAPLLASC